VRDPDSRNFLLILTAQFTTKLGDALANPKTVLAWIMAAVEAPVGVTGMLVPIRESGSLIPQALVAGWISRRPIRKWIWVSGSLVQAACVAGMGVAALALEGLAAGVTIVALLALFSVARSFCSVAAKDVLGKTVPKHRRGRLNGFSVGAAGLVSILVGLALQLPLAQSGSVHIFGGLLISAGSLWILGALIYSRIGEQPGPTRNEHAGGAEVSQRLRLLVTDRSFRRFVVARALLLCTALSTPYYVLLARERIGGESSLLGLFIVAGGLASLIAAPVWGQFADRSSRLVMSAAAAISGLTGISVFGVVAFLPELAAHAAFLPGAFFVASIAHDGVRVGRKTYLVDLADGNRRTDYVAASNTVIGVILLLAGLAGALSVIVTVAGVVLLLSLAGLIGAWLSARLREVQ
jgi:MFS family permease